jgi:hypothetical protein
LTAAFILLIMVVISAVFLAIVSRSAVSPSL